MMPNFLLPLALTVLVFLLLYLLLPIVWKEMKRDA